MRSVLLPAILSVLAHAGLGLWMVRALAPRLRTPDEGATRVWPSEAIEVGVGEGSAPAPAATGATDLPDRGADELVADPRASSGRPSATTRKLTIAPWPIAGDSPDVLERIQGQIASWDPRLVLGARQRSGMLAGGGELPDPARAMAEVDEVVHAHEHAFQICHGVGQRSSLQIGGRVRVRLVIAAHGSVVAAQPAGGDFPDDAVRRCVAQTFTRLRFPPPPGGVAETVTYPVTLVAGDVTYGPGEGGSSGPVP